MICVLQVASYVGSVPVGNNFGSFFLSGNQRPKLAKGPVSSQSTAVSICFSLTPVMSSIVTAVFKATVGLLVNKGRDVVAERLKDGDVTDKQFRDLIVREIDDIESKLEGLAKRDLLASVSFFNEGIEFLYEVFQKTSIRGEYCAVTAQAAAGTASAEAVSFDKGARKLAFTSLDE